MKKCKLNLSQTQILNSERAFADSAINTISLKLRLPDISAQCAAAAADRVFACSDVFCARIDADEGGMVYSPPDILRCKVAEESSPSAAEDYMSLCDGTRLDMMRQPYIAQAIPLTDGGCILYARFHHIIIDGYGMSLFVQRVLDLLGGKEILPSAFFCEKPQSRESDEPFWRAYFDGADFEPSLFGDKPEGLKYFCLSKSLDADFMDRIEDFAQKNGVTVPSVFGAAYAFYLAQSTGKDDGVILMPRLNRKESQMQTLGCYTLVVPVRLNVRSCEDFACLCAEFLKSARSASAHKATGFDRILSALRDEGIVSDSISNYGFNFYPFSCRSEIPYELNYSVAGAQNTHLTLNLFSSFGGGTEMTAMFRSGVYTREKAEFFIDALLGILSQAIAGVPLGDMEIAGAKERAKLNSLKGEKIEIDGSLTIPSLFARAAEKYGDRPALYAGEHSLSFNELDDISTRIACVLIGKGVKSGDIVAYMLNRDHTVLPVILGIAKSGAAFVPIDPAYPKDRVTYILANCGAKYLVSSPKILPESEYAFLDVALLLQGDRRPERLPRIRQTDLAYLIYTSGTTGKPKGVMLTHAGIANIVHPMNNPFNRFICANCRGIVAIGSVCFDISLFEMFVPLFNGLFVEFGNEKSMIDGGELAAHIVRHRADILHCTPSRIAAYLHNPSFCNALEGVKAILCAGEVLSPALVDELKERYSISVFNGYGPTETTIGATITEAGDTLSIGNPIANTGIMILSRKGRFVPFGVTGEICIYGNGVGLGYKDRPEETAEKFTVKNGERIYKTGDIGYFSDDGRLIYLGRCDRQVKLRGLRIELGEIENVMGTYKNLSSCCCLVRKIDSAEHLAAFYTTVDGNDLDEESLKEHMQASLTQYMIPDIFKRLAVMPWTPGGKLDMRALEKEELSYHTSYRQPVTRVEVCICAAFAEALRLERVGLDDNFFQLGGSSLESVELMLLIEQNLGLKGGETDLSDIYKYPTPALLAEALKAGNEEDTGYDISSLDYGDIRFQPQNIRADVKERNLGNVLLTGATGFLGVHILADLLKRRELFENIVCLARPKGKISAEKRIKTALFYYSEGDEMESYGDKWTAVAGDVTLPSLFSDECPCKIDTVINCAANVAHFAYGDLLEKTNTQAVENLISFCTEHGARLCHVSTISVGGLTRDKNFPRSFSEDDLYIGQQIHNEYIFSKYMAEYTILKAASARGLRYKIMRVGNLQGRISDGEFQMNMRTNAFTRRLASYIKIGAVPRSVYESSVNFSPVDDVAHMIVSLLAGLQDSGIYHVYPPAEIPFRKLFNGLKELGYRFEVVPDDEFNRTLEELKRLPSGRRKAEGLLTERPNGNLSDIPVSQKKTEFALSLLNEKWSATTDEYIHKYLSVLSGMNVFEGDN